MSDKNPEPVVFKPPRSRKCMICNDEEMSSWLSECLKITEESGQPKPSARFVHGELSGAFGKRSPAHENSTRRHLELHDSRWGAW
jgi:hypothetical protein